MNDGDITEQLRIAAPLARAHMDSTDLVGWPIRFILLEAAAEIERLRSVLQFYADPFEYQTKTLDRDPYSCDWEQIPDFYNETDFGSRAAVALLNAGAGLTPNGH